MPTDATKATKPSWWRRLPQWVGYAAGGWSLVYGALGLYWALGGAGFPFGSENDPQHALSVLGDVQAETAAPVIAILGLVGTGMYRLLVQPGQPDAAEIRRYLEAVIRQTGLCFLERARRGGDA